MDAVYVCRSGQNFELRFSLRSLARFVPHDQVHIVGGWPPWVDGTAVQLHDRPAAATKYATTTAHLRYACERPDISDPFMLWNDDFYALSPMGDVGEACGLHRGPLEQVVSRYRAMKGAWADGLRATAAHLARLLPGPLWCYELHVPLVVHKAHMLHAISIAETLGVAAPHKRTLYGNLARLGGREVRDWKVTRANQQLPPDGWCSSDDAGFPAAVAPVLKRLLPDPSPYEIRAGSSPRSARSSARSTTRTGRPGSRSPR